MGKKNRPVLIKGYEEECQFEDETLISVVSLREACIMWGKSETALRNAMIKGHVQCRKGFTGGDWLLSRHSLIKHYGQPKDDITCRLLK